MIALVCLILLVLIYIYTTRNHDYWAKRNVKSDAPIPLFGNHFQNTFGIKSICDLHSKLYNKYPDEKVVGYYCGTQPELIIRDPDIIRDILSVDFAYFYRRGLGRDIRKEPLLKNLFNVDGDIWKLLRHRLTPAFTTSKLKNMFPLIIKCAEQLQVVGEDIVARGGECDVRDLMARFSTDFIGACGFGVEMESINNEDSFFRRIGKKIFTRSVKDLALFGVWELLPESRKMLSLFDKDLEKTLIDIVSEIFKQRNFKPCGRNDFVDLLLDLSAKGKVVGESVEHRNPDGSPKQVELELDFLCLVAQIFVFFAAGFETSSSSTSYTLHELAFYPDIQAKVQAEIDEVLAKYDNKLCYEAVSEMPLLDMAFKESLRKFPSLGVLNRVCAKKYHISKLGITIDPGVKISIPVQAIQTDNLYYDNPDEFRPERFTPDETKKRNKYVYLPFGDGPRACIGARLGLMQSLTGLAAVLQKFSVEPSKKTSRRLKVNPRLNVVQGVMDGIPLKLTLRQK